MKIKIISLPKNASKWKHGLGGYLFEGGGPKVTLVDSNKVRMDTNGIFSDENGNIIGDSIVLPEVTVKPATPQTNDSSYYQQWLMRQADRGGKNMSSSDKEAYDRMMSRVANQNEVKNFTGFDGTIHKHGSGALEQVSPEFDILTLGRQLYTDGLLSSIGNAGKNAWNTWNTSKNTIPSALEYAYNRNKKLNEIGTIGDYGEYIKTVFPQSKIKDIQYHMGPKGLTELKPSTGEIWNTNPGARGIYVTPERSYIEAIRKFTTDRLEKPSALTYIKRNLTPNGWREANEQFTDVYPLLVDTRNPMRTRGNWTWGMKDKKYQEVMNHYDAIINSGPRWWQNVHKMPETIVPKSEQVHILGTDADVEGFRNFMSYYR